MHPIVVSRVCDFHLVSISKLDSKLEIENQNSGLVMCFRPVLILCTQFPKLIAMVVSKIILVWKERNYPVREVLVHTDFFTTLTLKPFSR